MLRTLICSAMLASAVTTMGAEPDAYSANYMLP
jgi:hypothetical protein